jgi:hypothetical protein
MTREDKDGRIKLEYSARLNDKFDGKKDQQIMWGLTEKRGEHLHKRCKELRALSQREVSHPQDIDRNTVPANSQRIRGSKGVSRSNDACAGMLPQVWGQGGDDQMGEIQAYSQDGREEVWP